MTHNHNTREYQIHLKTVYEEARGEPPTEANWQLHGSSAIELDSTNRTGIAV